LQVAKGSLLDNIQL
ncbi:CDP-diacylglycerol--glycerol-3-phosphate 3-phosphatidyltransferase, partial [Haemophilus influenzae]